MAKLCVKLIKISPIWRLTVESLQLTFVLTSKSRDIKTRPNIKNPVASCHCKWRRR